MAKVLVIDDSSSSRALLKGILAGIGATVSEAADGEEGLRVLRAEKPVDLVLLDWHMDKMDGPAFLKVVRADPELLATRIMMVSAESNPYHVRDAIQLGLNGYILKPFNRQVVLERMTAVLGVAPAPA